MDLLNYYLHTPLLFLQHIITSDGGFLLLEDGSFLLQENGDRILL